MNDNFDEVDRVLCRIKMELFDFSIITPINLVEEYEKFSQNRNYSPQFKYNHFDASKYVKQIERLNVEGEGFWKDVFVDFKQELLDYAKILKGLGTKTFSTKDYFGRVDNDLVEIARKRLKEPCEIVRKKFDLTVSSDELGKILIERVKKLEGSNWSVMYRKRSSSTVAINPGRKLIIIKANTMFSRNRVKKLLVHEIDTHVRRSIEGAKQKFKIFRVGFSNYLETEEGLAKWNEIQAGVTNEYFDKIQALYVIAGEIAKKGGFLEIYDLVSKYLGPGKRAFMFCYRIKRGMSDTSQPGGFFKDHLYLAGEMKVKKFVEQGGNIEDLYAGKISIDFLEMYGKYLK